MTENYAKRFDMWMNLCYTAKYSKKTTFRKNNM